MNSLPPPLGPGEVRIWRIDQQAHYETWASGEGAFRVGGRWNSAGIHAVYTSLDPATACLEVAVHKSLKVLDTAPHYLTSARIIDPSKIHVVDPNNIPNPNWLTPITPNKNQQEFGDALLKQHPVILIPSAVSKHSWNLIFDADQVSEFYDEVTQERFALDPRLQSP
ncbi:RES domain-containing protein [Pseudovibrio sp. Tun.PSC04-5.I4]|uniref:RES family NAD+ phosphorylase n=1 Tax=Pseudovibrio sp. Tun.PSC04-5.I4 TaxID=1798213 RepID=UPI00088C0906|nr:RES domain-containing protein [Pseudovibrio sp. Tun.PSC04-5.I4]SDR49093.1 RES domain-containing protein [Pseudovibrio sp. Tun.PSC04-5.I4]